MNILNSEVESFVKDSSISFDTIRDIFILKVDFGNNLVGVFAQDRLINKLQFVYHLATNKVLLVAEFAKPELFKNSEIEITSYNDFLLKLNKAIKEEFQDIINSLELDEVLYKDSQVLEMFDKAKGEGVLLDYQIPKINSYDKLSLLDIIYGSLDINEEAYSFLEDYLKKNPTYLRECQRITVANELIKAFSKEEGKDFSWKEILGKIKSILTTCNHKSVNICYELGNNEQITDNFKITQTLLDGLPPTYSIVRITWKKEVLYDRDELKKDIKSWKTELSENMEFLNTFYRYQATSFTTPYYLFFSNELLNNKDFSLLFLKNSLSSWSREALERWKEKLTIIPDKFKEDSSFVKSFIEDDYYIGKNIVTYLKEGFIELFFPKLISNEKIYETCIKVNPETYKCFPIEIQRNPLVIKALINFQPKADSKEDWSISYLTTEFFTEEVLNSDKLIQLVEDLAKKSPNKIGVHSNLLNKITDKNIILTTCQKSKSINVSFIPNYLLEDKDFILKAFENIRDLNFEEIYQSLKIELREDKEIIRLIFEKNLGRKETRMNLINSGKISIKEIYNLLLDEIGSIDAYKASIILGSLNSKELLDLLDINPELISHIVSRLSFSGFRTINLMDYLKKAIKLNYKVIESISSYYLNSEIYLELLKVDFRIYAFIPEDYYSIEIFEYLKDKVYIMKELNGIRTTHIYKYFALDKEFIREQAKFNSNILSDILPTNKRINVSSQSLQEDKEFVLELIELNPENIYGLAKRSKFWKDLDFAKKVVELKPDAIDLFPKSIIKSLKAS